MQMLTFNCGFLFQSPLWCHFNVLVSFQHN